MWRGFRVTNVVARRCFSSARVNAKALPTLLLAGPQGWEVTEAIRIEVCRFQNGLLWMLGCWRVSR